MVLGGLLGAALVGSVLVAVARRRRAATAAGPDPRPPVEEPPARVDGPGDRRGRRAASSTNPAWTGDLDGMVERRLVRILVMPNRTDYYLDHGAPKGLTAEYGAGV